MHRPANRPTTTGRPPSVPGRFVVALSGGVDSSVAALRLLESGHEVEAVFMKNWEEDDTAQYCSAAEDLADAQSVCDRLGIRLRAVNFAAEYWERVFERFLAEYEAGRTPNPDIWCNREIKFHEFHHYANDLGIERIATGHYARIATDRDGPRLLKGRDPHKDQSYFLYAIETEALERTAFPVGALHKTEVREIARRAGLATHAKKGSTGICFIGERPFRTFLSTYLAPAPGPIVTPEGHRIGEHMGLAFYTLGQRQGLGVGGQAGSSGEPWYVADKRPADNALVVVQGRRHSSLLSGALVAEEVNWIGPAPPPRRPLAATAKVRFRQSDQRCRISPLGPGRVLVRFDEPQWAVTPGQSVVFYRGEVCLGGGTITLRAAPGADLALDRGREA